MAYRVRVERIGEGGAPGGKAALYEADTEIEAVTIAAYEVDAHRSIARRVATVFNPAGVLVLAYAGRAGRGRCEATVSGRAERPTTATRRS